MATARVGRLRLLHAARKKVERVSYDVMMPSVARGILEAIHWKPAIRWVIDRTHVLKPIRFANVHRNELDHKIPADSVRTAMKRGGVCAAAHPDRGRPAATRRHSAA